MRMAQCPRCKGLYGPLVNDLLRHLRDAHGLAAEWYEASSGTLKLAGFLPGSLEFVKREGSAE